MTCRRWCLSPLRGLFSSGTQLYQVSIFYNFLSIESIDEIIICKSTIRRPLAPKNLLLIHWLNNVPTAGIIRSWLQRMTSFWEIRWRFYCPRTPLLSSWRGLSRLYGSLESSRRWRIVKHFVLYMYSVLYQLDSPGSSVVRCLFYLSVWS